MSDAPTNRLIPAPLVWEGARRRKQSEAGLEVPGREPARELGRVPDEELVRLMLLKDEKAFQEFFRRHLRFIFSIAIRVLHDQGEAEEIVQDVFFHVHCHSDQFDPARGSVVTWMKQVAYFRALDRRQYLARRGFYAGTDSDPEPDTLEGSEDLERRVQAKLNRDQLRKAFATLPEKQREVLELYHFEGMSLREISERIQETLGNTRHHYYRGIEQLRKSAAIRKLEGEWP